jgi:hypothetical protein
MITFEDLPFLDIARLAVDHDDHVGVFFSGGGGFIPETSLASVLSEFDIEGALERLPRYSEASNLVLPLEAYLSPAERGLYVFDCSNPHGGDLREQRRYRRTTTPVHPRMIQSLPQDLQVIARATNLSPLRFAVVSECTF